eukprot:jgi/Mesvir1/28072/Mv04665-RA.1
MNAPDRSERFVLPEGVKKLSYEKDTKVPNAAMFVIQREDHTVGNLIRVQLLKDPNVLFAGYQLPHPLLYKVNVKIQTTKGSSPMEALETALTDVNEELALLKKSFLVIVTNGGSICPVPVAHNAFSPMLTG